MPDRTIRIALAPLAAALALVPMLILGSFAAPPRTLAACVDAGDLTCFVMTPTQGLPGAKISAVSYLTLDCPEPLQLKFFQTGEVVDDPHPSPALLPTGAPNAFEFVVPNLDPGASYVQPSCIPTQSFTSGVQTQFIVLAVPSPVATPDPTAPATSIDVAETTPPATGLPIGIMFAVAVFLVVVGVIATQRRRTT
jgi:hypothetical protein